MKSNYIPEASNLAELVIDVNAAADTSLFLLPVNNDTPTTLLTSTSEKKIEDYSGVEVDAGE